MIDESVLRVLTYQLEHFWGTCWSFFGAFCVSSRSSFLCNCLNVLVNLWRYQPICYQVSCAGRKSSSLLSYWLVSYLCMDPNDYATYHQLSKNQSSLLLEWLVAYLSLHCLPVRVLILNFSSSLLATKVHFLVPCSLTNSTMASSSYI